VSHHPVHWPDAATTNLPLAQEGFDRLGVAEGWVLLERIGERFHLQDGR
jgi:hypothetical protein